VSTTGPGQSAGLEAPMIQEVRYRLPELLAEIKAERSVANTPAFCRACGDCPDWRMPVS
jgi:hypothetical protein